MKKYIVVFFILCLLVDHSYSKTQGIKLLPDNVNALSAPTVLDSCFAPATSMGEQCSVKIIQRIGQAKKFIILAMYSFTDTNIANALVSASSPPRNVPVLVIIDKKWYQQNRIYAGAVDILKNAAAYPHISKVIVVEKDIPDPDPDPNSVKPIFHHKVIITCEEQNYQGSQLFSLWIGTGSYNYTVQARKNNENYVFINETASVDRLPETFTCKYLKNIDVTSSEAENYLLGIYYNWLIGGVDWSSTTIRQLAAQSGNSAPAMLYNLATHVMSSSSSQKNKRK